MTISFDDIEKMCSEFVNDTDTTIGMQCQWLDYLVHKVPIDMTREEIIQAIGIDDARDHAVPVPVHHEQYGDMTAYVAIRDNLIVISTKEWLLCV